MDSNLRLLEIAEPPHRGAINSERIIVAREGDSFRFMPDAKRDLGRREVREKRRIEPRWAVFVQLGNHDENLSSAASDFLPGLIYREARWTYALKASRADYGFDGNDDKENPPELPPEEIQKLRPLVVAELNLRYPGTKLGDRLEKMLDDGLEVSSLSYPPENAAVLLRWLGIMMGALGLGSMFVRPRAIFIPAGVLPMSQNEMLLTKIAPVRARLYKRYKDAC